MRTPFQQHPGAVRKIGIMVPPVTDFYRCITLGIINTFSSDPSFQIHMDPLAVPYLTWDALEHWQGDGIIALIHDRKQQSRLEALGLPVVNVSGAFDGTRYPAIVTDNARIGELGAQHLMGSGVRHFLFYGQRDTRHSLDRRNGFAATIRKAALHYHEFLFKSSRSDYKNPSPGHNPAQLRIKHLERLLASAKLPMGVMAVNDRYAMDIIHACHSLNLQIPNEVPIIGVDDDVMICNALKPTLSSIRQNGESIGHHAATLLKRLLSGPGTFPIRTVIPPLGLVPRESTNILKSHHPHVNAALRFIQNHVADTINVHDVVKHVSVSRRTLEKHFKAATHSSLHVAIRRCHIEHAKTLLATSSRTVSDISHLSGYRSILRFMASFRTETGMTPGQWRRKYGVKLRPADPR